MQPYFREMVWGGRRLQELYGKNLPAGDIGESFELSAYAERESRVAAGPLAGWHVQRLTETCGAGLVGERIWEAHGNAFPLLIKFLDAQRDLSIQVHPDDAYARARGLGDSGKMEAWYVVYSQGGRIAYGLEEGVDREVFSAAVAEDRVEEVVRFSEVRPGDVVFSPPGTVHALCGGVVVYEVQQSSDLTFRIYDYKRPGLDGKPRQLHVEQALEVIDFETHLDGPRTWRELPQARNEGALLVESEYFRLELCLLLDGRRQHAAGDSFAALTAISGAVEVRGSGAGHRLSAGDTALVPAGREFVVEQRGGDVPEYLIASATG